MGASPLAVLAAHSLQGQPLAPQLAWHLLAAMPPAAALPAERTGWARWAMQLAPPLLLHMALPSGLQQRPH